MTHEWRLGQEFQPAASTAERPQRNAITQRVTLAAETAGSAETVTPQPGHSAGAAASLPDFGMALKPRLLRASRSEQNAASQRRVTTR